MRAGGQHPIWADIVSTGSIALLALFEPGSQPPRTPLGQPSVGGSRMAKQPEAVTSGPFLPPVKVRVLPGVNLNHEEKPYKEGDVVELPARTADHLVVAGQVEVVTDE
jgi:hypothetical protein